MNTKKKYLQPLCDIGEAETGEIMIVVSNIDMTDTGGSFDAKGWTPGGDGQNSWNNIWNEE